MDAVRYVPLLLLAAFYLFFFARNITLRLRSGRRVKFPGKLVNMSIALSALSATAYLVPFLFPGAPGFFRPLFLFRGLFPAGTVLMAMGVTGSILGSLSLGRSWRVGIPNGEKTELVTDGLFRWSRNPYFASFFLLFAGKCLTLPSVPVLTFSAAAVVSFHCLVRAEERHLETLHGAAYRAYCRRTGRYFFRF